MERGGGGEEPVRDKRDKGDRGKSERDNPRYNYVITEVYIPGKKTPRTRNKNILILIINNNYNDSFAYNLGYPRAGRNLSGDRVLLIYFKTTFTTTRIR